VGIEKSKSLLIGNKKALKAKSRLRSGALSTAAYCPRAFD
jgi:hypothetical protein